LLFIDKLNIIIRTKNSPAPQIFKKSKIKPWQRKQWCIGELNGEYLCRMENIPDIYAGPYNPTYPVICFDEKTYQFTGYVTGPLPPEPGRPRRDDYHYKRNGICNILCAFKPAAGKRVARITQRRTCQDYAGFMKEPGGLYPDARRIRLAEYG